MHQLMRTINKQAHGMEAILTVFWSNERDVIVNKKNGFVSEQNVEAEN